MSTTRVGICSVVIALVVLDITPAAAQYDPFAISPGPRRVDISGSGGLRLSSDWSDLVLLGSVSSVSGVLEQVLARDLVVDPGPVFDGVVTYWEGRYGFRAHGGFSRSCLAVGRSCTAARSAERRARSMSTRGCMTSAVPSGSSTIGAKPWCGRTFSWASGAVTYDIEQTVGPPLTFIERRPPVSGDIIVSRSDPDPLLIAVNELGIETRFALNLGIGSDFRVPVGGGSFGVRLEVSDHIHRSPVRHRHREPGRIHSRARYARRFRICSQSTCGRRIRRTVRTIKGAVDATYANLRSSPICSS